MTVCLFLFLLKQINYVFMEKISVKKHNYFLQQDMQYDIFFLGTSHSYVSNIPIEIYKNTSLRSYCISNSDMSIPASYWTFKNAIQYHKPQLLVVDLFYFCSGAHTHSKGQLHRIWDVFPPSRTKIQAIKDLYPNDKMALMEFLFPFSVYHNRYKDITSKDIRTVTDKRYLMGGEIAFSKQKAEMPWEKLNDAAEDFDSSKKYITMLMDECRNREIQVIFTYNPFHASEYYIDEANKASEYVRQKGGLCINFLEDQSFDNKYDYADGNHLNYGGAYKYSLKISEIINKCGNLDKKELPKDEKVLWDQMYNDYIDDLYSVVRDGEHFPHVSLVIRNPFFKVRIESGAAAFDFLESNYEDIFKLKNVAVKKNIQLEADEIHVTVNCNGKEQIYREFRYIEDKTIKPTV